MLRFFPGLASLLSSTPCHTCLCQLRRGELWALSPLPNSEEAEESLQMAERCSFPAVRAFPEARSDRPKALLIFKGLAALFESFGQTRLA